MTEVRIFARVCTLAVGLLAAGLSGGCGVRGPLEVPAEAKGSGQNSTAETPADPGKDSAVKQKPHKEFLLDNLLR